MPGLGHGCRQCHAIELTPSVLQEGIALDGLRRRDTTPARKQLGITLNFLAQGDHYHSLATTWGIHKSSVHKHLHHVMPVLDQKLFRRNILFPTGQELKQVIADFEHHQDMPQCAGAIDGCFIPMETPKGITATNTGATKTYMPSSCWLLWTPWASLLTYIGEPASVGDGASFNRCKLKKRLQSGRYLPRSGFVKEIPSADGTQRLSVHPFIVADAAFALSPFIMKAYDDPDIDSPQHAYNHSHTRTRRVVENAFGFRL